jgi:hypothetical protein
MSGGAFSLLKSGQNGPETAKQAEIRLANLLKILDIGLSREAKPSPRPQRTCHGCICGDFRRTWLIGQNH